MEQNAGHASGYENKYGAPIGGKGSPKRFAIAHPHNTEDQSAAFEGTLASQAFEDATRKRGVFAGEPATGNNAFASRFHWTEKRLRRYPACSRLLLRSLFLRFA